jgi:hypothetical protein
MKQMNADVRSLLARRRSAEIVSRPPKSGVKDGAALAMPCATGSAAICVIGGRLGPRHIETN